MVVMWWCGDALEATLVRPRRLRARVRAARARPGLEALRIVLVNELVPSGTSVERATELAHAVAALPQPAIRTDDTEALARGSGRPLEDGLWIEAECFDRLLDTPEIREGLRRFAGRDHSDRRSGAASTPELPRPRHD